jgi:putative oxidoreductase
VLLSLQARLSGLSLFLYLIFTTPIFPNFWALPTAQQQLHEIIFLKNLVVMGGVALVWAFGMGSYSLDTRKMRNGK